MLDVFLAFIRRNKMEIFHTCSTEDNPENHRGYLQQHYLAENGDGDTVLIKVCSFCMGIVETKFMLVDIRGAQECRNCNEWIAKDGGEWNESCCLCSECCNCSICDGCERHMSHSCDNCNQCNNCCGCSECRDCSSQVECHDCDRCYDCCGCDSDGEEIQEGAPWRAESPKMRLGFKCTRLVGVEWEYNSCQFEQVETWADRWRGGVHSDGSCGWEAVTAPLSGDYISQCLTGLGNAFQAGNAGSDDNCGIHVHVDAHDLSWRDMYRLLWVYSHVEPVLFLLAGQQRIQNHYCRPCGRDYREALGPSLLEKFQDRKGKVLEVAFSADSNRLNYGYTARTYQRRTPGKKDGGRYRALNICPWLAGRKEKKPDTTVEFRLHRNTLDAKRVIGWAQLCARLVEWSANATDKEAQELPKSALRALCQVIAPDCAPWILNRVKGWRADLPKLGGNYPRRIHISEGRYRI